MSMVGNLSHWTLRQLRRLLGDHRWFVRRYFEFTYRKEDPWGTLASQRERERLRRTIAQLGDRRFRRALEIGCGEGFLTRRLVERTESLVALDISRRALERAAQRLDGDERVEFRVHDLLVDPLPGTFDLIVCAEVLFYFPRDRLVEVRDKIVDALEEGGELLLGHARTLADDDCGLEYKDFGARTIHGLFFEEPRLETLDDEVREQYRISLLRKSREKAVPEAVAASGPERDARRAGDR